MNEIITMVTVLSEAMSAAVRWEGVMFLAHGLLAAVLLPVLFRKQSAG